MNDYKKLVLSAFMVAGAAIGSGVLALPILAAGPGVITTWLFITFTFAVSLWISMISIDIYAKYDNHSINAATLAIDYFGKKGYWFTTIVNVLSLGACAAAYVNAGGDLLAKTVLPIFHIQIPSQLGMIIFFVVFMPAFVIGLGFISRLNGIIFTIKYVCLIGGILLGLRLINVNMFELIPSGVIYLGAGASTMFCIWAMHMTIPLVMQINGWNPHQAKKAVFIGLLIPGAAYIGWMLLIFSLVSRADFQHLVTIGEIMHFALTKPGVPKIISTLVGVFASITVLTAFLSVGFSLVAFVMDALRWKESPITRLWATLISFILPVIIALTFSKGFVVIYQQSNIFIITAALVPIAAAYVYNKKYKLALSPTVIILIIGTLIIISQLLNDVSLFPSFN